MMDPCWRSPAQLRSFQIMTAGVGRGSLVRCHGGGGGIGCRCWNMFQRCSYPLNKIIQASQTDATSTLKNLVSICTDDQVATLQICKLMLQYQINVLL